MRLTELLNKIKTIPDISRDIFVILVIILVSFGGFGLGRLSALEEKRNDDLRIVGQKIADNGILTQTEGDRGSLNVGTVTSSPTSIKGLFVGSKSGKTYYAPWCAGVKRIHEENKVWFSSKDDAEMKGYKPSSSCKS